jgi:methyl-accepting chemotaxis protein
VYKRQRESGVISGQAAKAFQRIADGVGRTTASIRAIDAATAEQGDSARHVGELIEKLAARPTGSKA